MQVLQLRITDTLEDEVLGQTLLEDRVAADGVEMRQVSGHSGLVLRGALSVVALSRGAAGLLGEFRLAQPITLALNGYGRDANVRLRWILTVRVDPLASGLFLFPKHRRGLRRLANVGPADGRCVK